MNGALKFAGIAAGLIIALEIAVGASGIVDFPIYTIGAATGYSPKESQSGKFLHKNDWYFNDKSMPIAENWDPRLHPNILLIGNSIVAGGDAYRQEDELAAQIQKRLAGRTFVWPVAAGGGPKSMKWAISIKIEK